MWALLISVMGTGTPVLNLSLTGATNKDSIPMSGLTMDVIITEKEKTKDYFHCILARGSNPELKKQSRE